LFHSNLEVKIMKKLTILGMGCAVLLALSACNKSEQAAEAPAEAPAAATDTMATPAADAAAPAAPAAEEAKAAS
jgi:Amt family ammonium transporter